MNILLITETYPPEINGVARTLAQMVEGLARLGHRMTLVRPRQADAEALHTDAAAVYEVPGVPLPGYPGLQFGLPAYRLIQRLLLERQIDAAYIATEGPLGRSALRACLRRGVPALTGMHTNFHQYSAHYGAGLLGPLLLHYLRRFHNRAAGTLVPTASLRDALARQGFVRLHTWPRGVHTGLFSPARRDPRLRAEWGLAESDLAVLYVGRIAPEKNIDLAFDAFTAIRRAHAGARFVLVGGGPAEQRLRAAHPDALFLGPREGEELARHYASGDLFLFPSETETFGNVTLEALASGLAVVSYDLAAAHELIRHGHNGLLATPGQRAGFVDQAVHCAGDPALRQTLKRHARATALQQDWPRLLARLEGLFLDVAGGRIDDGFEGTAESTE
jgi:glycosyltransferase involved in cell wall biosynthesis